MGLLNPVDEQKPRQIAARVLARRDSADDFVENLLERALLPAQLSSADRGLCHELVYGVVRWQAALDWLIARKTPGRAQKPAGSTHPQPDAGGRSQYCSGAAPKLMAAVSQ